MKLTKIEKKILELLMKKYIESENKGFYRVYTLKKELEISERTLYSALNTLKQNNYLLNSKYTKEIRYNNLSDIQNKNEEKNKESIEEPLDVIIFDKRIMRILINVPKIKYFDATDVFINIFNKNIALPYVKKIMWKLGDLQIFDYLKESKQKIKYKFNSNTQKILDIYNILAIRKIKLIEMEKNRI